MNNQIENNTDKIIFDLDLHKKYLRYRRTKIIATIGPASSSEKIIHELISKGLNVVRINFSHGEPEEHLKTISRIRKISDELKTSVAIIGDLCGPKIRVGTFENGQVNLEDGSTVKITSSQVTGNNKLIHSQYDKLHEVVNPGERIMLDDGNLELVVKLKDKDHIEAEVIHGGILKDKKGMNLPDTKLNISALTEKDRKDVEYCLKGEVDFIALSFVQKAQDIVDLKALLNKKNASVPVIAKIEKPQAIDNIYDIIEIADGIMIARGDLGVELLPQKVPIVQNKLIQLANQNNKPVIVATQMLESMIDNARPTRAEITDVADACLTGADAVMLSGETAVGKFPVKTFEMMDSILREAETHQFFSMGGNFRKYTDSRKNHLPNAIGKATAQLSRDLSVKCIFVITRTGYTARIVSSDRPAAPIITLTISTRVLRMQNLFWGVYPNIAEVDIEMEEYHKYGEKFLKDLNLAKKGDFVVFLSGVKKDDVETNTIVAHRMT